jgi:hypothetical protein
MRLVTAALCSASILAAAGAGLAGCRDVAGAPPCMPPTYTVSPAEARPGDQVTVRAQDTACDARYGGDARVQVTVRDAAGVNVLEELAPMTDDGGFTFVFTVPAATAAGQAGVSAYPYGVDWCDDTGVNNRAASAPQDLVRVSCAERLVPLVILGG